MDSNDTNKTVQWSGFDVPRDLQVVMTTVYAITFVIALLGNSLVIHAVYHFQYMHTTTNVLIANMAAADLITTLFAMPYSIVYLFVQGNWFGGVLGSISCKTVHFVIAVTIAASIIALFLVSLERFGAIVYPLKYIPLIHNKKLLTVVVWGVSVIFMSIYLVVYRVNIYNNNTYLCELVWQPEFNKETSPRTFYLTVFLFLYLVPLVAIAIMHGIIMSRVWNRQVPGTRLELNRRAVSRSRQSVVKMLAVVLAVFAICWIPLHIMHLYINFHHSKFKEFSPWLVMPLFWVSHANSAINPYIFITMNQKFKKIVQSVLMQFISCNRIKHPRISIRGMIPFSEFQGYSLATDSPIRDPYSPTNQMRHFTTTKLDAPTSLTKCRSASRESTL